MTNQGLKKKLRNREREAGRGETGFGDNKQWLGEMGIQREMLIGGRELTSSEKSERKERPFPW